MAAATTSAEALSVPTKTLVVNPAFLQEMKDSNPDLWQTQHAVRQICHSDLQPPELLQQLVRLLNDFRDQIALQFALEEAYGYQRVLKSVVSTTSSCARLAEMAHGQHCGLYLQISGLAEQAEELQYRGVQRDPLSKLIDSVMVFDEVMREHEMLEGDLIDQSFDVLTKLQSS